MGDGPPWETSMKKIMVLAAVFASLAGCSEYSQSDRALVGGGVGATTGAVIGGASGRGVGGALVGGVIGGATGAIIGGATTPKACWARDAYGRSYRVRCP